MNAKPQNRRVNNSKSPDSTSIALGGDRHSDHSHSHSPRGVRDLLCSEVHALPTNEKDVGGRIVGEAARVIYEEPTLPLTDSDEEDWDERPDDEGPILPPTGSDERTAMCEEEARLRESERYAIEADRRLPATEDAKAALRRAEADAREAMWMAKAARERLREARWARISARISGGRGRSRRFVEVNTGSSCVAKPAYRPNVESAKEVDPREDGQAEDAKAALREAEAEARESMRVARAAVDTLREARDQASRGGQSRTLVPPEKDRRISRSVEVNGSSRVAKAANRTSQPASDEGEVLESLRWVEVDMMDLMFGGVEALVNVDDYMIEDRDNSDVAVTSEAGPTRDSTNRRTREERGATRFHEKHSAKSRPDKRSARVRLEEFTFEEEEDVIEDWNGLDVAVASEAGPALGSKTRCTGEERDARRVREKHSAKMRPEKRRARVRPEEFTFEEEEDGPDGANVANDRGASILSRLVCWKKMFKLRQDVSKKDIIPYKGGLGYC